MKAKKNNVDLIESTVDAWESGQLGRDEQHAKIAPQSSAELDEILGLQMISIRLSKELIESFKLLGEKYNMGYQPLMREALKRFADAELKMIAREMLQEHRDKKTATKTKNRKAA